MKKFSDFISEAQQLDERDMNVGRYYRATKNRSGGYDLQYKMNDGSIWNAIHIDRNVSTRVVNDILNAIPNIIHRES